MFGFPSEEIKRIIRLFCLISVYYSNCNALAETQEIQKSNENYDKPVIFNGGRKLRLMFSIHTLCLPLKTAPVAPCPS